MKSSYIQGIWDSRYFWSHLALSDLRSRWRRSFLGALWSMIQPLGMTLILSVVLSKLLHVDILRYAPYIFSGVIIWEFIVSAATNGSLSFLQAAPYIKQYKHPLAIYSLRTVLNAVIILMLASTPLLLWTLIVMPENFNVSWIAIFSLYPILVLMFWPLATFLAYVGARSRDLTPALALIMQALWFISPVSFEEKMFRGGGLNWLIDYNPIYHILQIIRAPLLTGQFPSVKSYLFCLLTIGIMTSLAVLLGYRSEKKVIFYI